MSGNIAEEVKKIIIEQLVQNGKSQEEANALIKDLISKWNYVHIRYIIFGYILQ